MSPTNKRPTRIGLWLLSRMIDKGEHYGFFGDVEEMYNIIKAEKGRFKAGLWFRMQIFRTILPFIKNHIYWSFSMFKNYLKIALRNLKKETVFSLVIISGLVVGLAVFILFLRIAIFGFGFDVFHKNADRLYNVVQVFHSSNKGEQHSSLTPAALLPAMLREFPEIEDCTRFYSPGRMIVKRQNENFFENRILFVDTNFLSFFTFKRISGDKGTVLSRPNSIVLTRSAAIKYFGDEFPLGKVLTLDNKIDVTVTGIVEDVPKNSTIYFDFLVSMETASSLYGPMKNRTLQNFTVFVRLPEGFKPVQLEEKFSRFIHTHFPEDPNSPKKIYLFPLLDFAFHGVNIMGYIFSAGPTSYYIILAMGILFLLVVCINFMNLSTARYTNRLREVGMRKVVGARRNQLVKQFLLESLFLTFIALFAALILYNFVRSAFTARLGDVYDLSLSTSPFIMISLPLITILVGILAGSYPAFFLSSFKPVQVLKGKLQPGKKGGRFRKILVVTQFAVSIFFIVFALVLKKQSDYLYHADIGFNRESVVVVPVSGEAKDNLRLLKDKLIRHTDVLSISALPELPGWWGPEDKVIPQGVSEENAWNMNIYGMDYNINDVLDLRMVQGRFFSENYDDRNHFIINETAVRQLKWQEPIGKELTVAGRKGTVIGVIKNFQFNSTHFPIYPTVIHLEQEKLRYMLVKVSNPERIPGVVGQIREHWQILAANIPFEFDTLHNHFYEISRMSAGAASEILGVVAIIAIFFSCLGLLGLASYAVRQKTKEIGIRKVLGASVSSITVMLGRDFIKPVVLSNVIALPIAYFVSNSLIRFAWAFRTDIGAGILIFAASMTLLTALIAVTSQTLTAAKTNPVEILRAE